MRRADIQQNIRAVPLRGTTGQPGQMLRARRRRIFCRPGVLHDDRRKFPLPIGRKDADIQE